MEIKRSYEEKIIKPINGWIMLAIGIVLIALSFTLMALNFDGIGVIFGVLLLIITIFMLTGLRLLGPNEAIVLTLFGKYHGTVKNEGFFFVNPFATAYNKAAAPGKTKKLSTKAFTLDNDKQKVNDLDGNPIEIGVMVTWQIEDTAKAVFNVENYPVFLSSQTDAAIRNIARQYPYDSTNNDEKTLRGSSKEISKMLQEDLDTRVAVAGIDIIEARIAHLAYSQEIASAMLQRQQAQAIVDARTKIVEGAVGMVEMALDKLSEENVCDLDEERKAQMVSNLMVVLCSNKDAQPVVNSGSLY